MKQTVLVVDDEINLLNLLQDNLEDAGYGVITAPDGEEALKRWIEKKPAAIILDIEMPKMNGWQVLKEIRQVSPKAPIIIILSAYAQPENIKRGLSMGANHYMTKPFKVRELLDSLEGLLAGGTS